MAALYLGLMSGTSADGIDAALVRYDDDAPGSRPALVFARTWAWEPALRATLVDLGQGGEPGTLDAMAALDVAIGRAFAAAAQGALAESGTPAMSVTAIGSHGQTLRHHPHGPLPYTLQLGCAATIAEITGITTVADFRRRDVAAGGQGAPLVPAFHAALLHAPGEDRAVLNLGGIANLTLLPSTGAVRGFDTGPANALMDAWCLRHAGARFDAGGALAARGQVDAGLLARLRDDPWFALPPPRSTGRDQFHLGWLDARLPPGIAVEDVQATLVALTASTVADALRATQPGTTRLVACGGGVHNPVLMAAIAAALPGVTVEPSSAHGLDPDAIEAMAFAWLARETLAGRPGNLPAVTGAAGPRILGAIHRA
jgi:anhydro-N-acetylmuramic acid kinase